MAAPMLPEEGKEDGSWLRRSARDGLPCPVTRHSDRSRDTIQRRPPESATHRPAASPPAHGQAKKSVPKRHGTAKALETKMGSLNSISPITTDATTWPKMPRLLPLAATQAPRTGRNGPMLRGSNRKTPSETMVADAPVSTRIHTSTPCTCSTTAEDLAAAATM
ncbi:unnamed protein product [Lampetra fluviatilis]